MSMASMFVVPPLPLTLARQSARTVCTAAIACVVGATTTAALVCYYLEYDDGLPLPFRLMRRRWLSRCRGRLSSGEDVVVRKLLWTAQLQVSLQEPKGNPQPAVLSRVPVGACADRWTTDYFETVAGDLKVSVHVSPTASLNFASKNFAYQVMSLRDMVQLMRNRPHDASGKRYYYYRSQHVKRNKPASLEVLGPLAEDFSLPAKLLEGYDIHSTVLRIASVGLRMWLHYDICDNFLCAIRGRKRVVLLPPSEVGNFYVKGSSSMLGSRALEHSSALRDHGSLDGGEKELWDQFPLAREAWARRLEVILEEGDVLFIPALWLHCTEALPPASANVGAGSAVGAAHEGTSHELCVSVNAFVVRSDMASLHDPKDVWANRELLPAQDAFRAFEDKMLPALQNVPPVHRSFYCRKAAADLLAMAGTAESEI